MQGKSVFVDEGKHLRVTHFGKFAEAKPQKDALFHPGINLPIAGGSLFRGPNLARSKRSAKFPENTVGFADILDGRAFAEERLNGLLEWMHAREKYIWRVLMGK